MRIRRTDVGRTLLRLAAAAALSAAWAVAAAAAEPEVIKGTVANIRPEALYLSDVGSPDDDVPPRDAMVAIDNNTEYFDAARRAARDDIVPGLRVLVRCRNGGEARTAVQVRIIGGKSP